MTAGEAGDFKCLRDPPQAPCLRRLELFSFCPRPPSLFEEYPSCPTRAFRALGGRSRCSAAGAGVESDGPSQQDGRAQAPSRCGHQNEHETVTSSGEILLRHAKASLTNAIRAIRSSAPSRPDTEDRSSFCLRWRMAIAIAGKACDLRGQALAGLADFRSWRGKLESRTPALLRSGHDLT